MQRLIRDPHAMIAAPVQGDVDGKPKRSHAVGISPMEWRFKTGARGPSSDE
jgi:hypothetical protein